MATQVQNGCMLIDAWHTDFGKVASFRVYEDSQSFNVVTFRRKTLEHWIGIVVFETEARKGRSSTTLN